MGGTAASASPAGGVAAGRPLRFSLGGARADRLYFAQVREDPLLEIEALRPGPQDTVVVVSSGGCTALSLLGAGAGRVVAVDLNVTQNHLVELKAAATALGSTAALAFLGGAPAARRDRRAVYAGLRAQLSPGARAYWDGHPRAVAGGVLGAGRTERFVGLVTGALRLAVHPPARVRRLLACRTLEEQRALYEAEWNSRRWRALFDVLLSRTAFERTFDPAFFAHVPEPTFARHFLALAERGLTRLPVQTNYFLHHMLTGRYPARPDGLPPYLTPDGAAIVASARGRLTLVDGGVTEYLRGCPGRSVHAFALSNIAEWLEPSQVEALFAEVARTAAPGARVCFRNFVGWTEVPERWREVVVEDRERGDALILRDRSLVQRRLAVCRVRGLSLAARPRTARRGVAVREAGPEDNRALLALAAACPMEGDVGLCVERRPDFFALNRLGGTPWRVGVAEDAGGEVVGCISVAERRAHLGGRVTRVLSVSDLKVRPDRRGRGVADALTRYVQGVALALDAADVPILVTIMAGNGPMEHRAAGPRGLPALTRFATLRAHAVPMLRRRGLPAPSLPVAAAGPADIPEMVELWQRVAAGRQLATAFDAESLRAWIEGAPALGISDYLLARGTDGRLRGFLALWAQESFKQLRVMSYSWRLAAFRAALRVTAPMLGAAPLPPVGQVLRHRTAVHVCVPADDPVALRALLFRAYHDLAGSGGSFFTLGLDVRDPLSSALDGLWAQPTDIHAYVTTARGAYAGPALDDRPLHHEIALT